MAASQFTLGKEGAKIEGFLPEANCNRCAHFKTCGIWRATATIEQAGMPIKLTEFLKTLPRICPEYSVVQQEDAANT